MDKPPKRGASRGFSSPTSLGITTNANGTKYSSQYRRARDHKVVVVDQIVATINPDGRVMVGLCHLLPTWTETGSVLSETTPSGLQFSKFVRDEGGLNANLSHEIEVTLLMDIGNAKAFRDLLDERIRFHEGFRNSTSKSDTTTEAGG